MCMTDLHFTRFLADLLLKVGLWTLIISQCDYHVRGILIRKSFRYQIVHAPKLFSLLHCPKWVFLAILGVPKMALGVPKSKF